MDSEKKVGNKITYIIIAIAIVLFGYIIYSVIQSKTNKENTMTATTTAQTAELRAAQPGDVIVIHYKGTLENGTQFDSSYDRGQPLVFQIGVGQVIPGWDEGLIGIKKGDTKHLVIPADKAYGAAGVTDPATKKVIIPKNATLIFDVEVLEVISKEDAERMVAEQQAKMGTSTKQ
jgi:FKBP-type peptidyl-prolyl cis-trans isomerase